MILLPDDPPLRKFTVTLTSGEKVDVSAHVARPDQYGSLHIIHLIGGDAWLHALFAPNTWIMTEIEMPTRDNVMEMHRRNEEHAQQLAQLAAHQHAENKAPHKKPTLH